MLAYIFDPRFLHPLYHGEYPEVMRERLGNQLPKFSEEDKKLLLNSLDFIGLNHYTSRFISHVTECTEKSYFYRTQEMERIGSNQNPVSFLSIYTY